MASADVDLFARPYSHDPSALNPEPSRRSANARGNDDLDDLFDIDAQIDSVFNDVVKTTETDVINARKKRQANLDEVGLGIDEEIKIKKARAPQAKLDEERLLSENGIPKLREITRKRLKFRGKGHEFTDVQRLLNTYQLWLDDLFPKAKFADGLVIIEKLGHSKRIKTMRQEWIDEGKPKPHRDEEDQEDAAFVPDDINRHTAGEVMTAQGEPESRSGHDEEDMSDEFLYGRPPQQEHEVDPDAIRDELDMMLAEDAARNPTDERQAAFGRGLAVDQFADDEEAMADMW